jgi:hypothetical protein
MTNSTNDYLTSSIIKGDPWVKEFCSAPSAEEMEKLIMKRLVEPNLNGPVVAYLSRAVSKPETPGEIIYDLVINSYADYDLCKEALGFIMKKIVNRNVKLTAYVLEDVFHLIERLVASQCSDDLYQWVKENVDGLTSMDGEKRRTLLNAINALSYCQMPSTNLGSFWTALWEQGNEYWWNAAFNGIRYFDIEKSITLVPKLIERKCSNTHFLLSSIWRVKDDERFANLLKKAIHDDQVWAGIAINTLAHKMKWSEKNNLIERLHDGKDSYLSTEEEDHIENMAYLGT